MQSTPLGDRAVLVTLRAKNAEAALAKTMALAAALNREPLAGVTDIVPAYSTVTVHYDPCGILAGECTPFDRVCAWINQMPKGAAKSAKAAPVVEVPVRYGGEDGPDLAEIARRAKLTEAEVVRVHSKAVYRVAAVGFAPGFPYLLGMPARLATPRLDTPRGKVPAGSVGIGGGQTGVYPLESPGGWSLVGRTRLRLFRPENEVAPTLFKPGDSVKFVPVARDVSVKDTEPAAEKRAFKVPKSAELFEVIKPGMLTTVQDLGRPGWQHLGITEGGVMDKPAARVANLLLGNDENAPLLEMTYSGPELVFLRDAVVAVTGAEIRDVPGWRPWAVKAGQCVSFGSFVRGARAYLAVSGGLTVPRVLGGAGTMLRGAVGGWQGRALVAGDRPGAGATTAEYAHGWRASPEFDATTLGAEATAIRFVRGPQWDLFTAASRRSFTGKSFRVSAKSDRMGLTLEGTALRADGAAELSSEGVAFGTIQVPPDGAPIVLMADRQTIGGYPKIAQIIAVDLPRLAQAKPGSSIEFVETTLAEAQAMLMEAERAIALFGMGAKAKFRSAPA